MPTTKIQQNIPSGWKQVTLGDLLSVTTGKRDANHGSPNGQYPFFTCAQRVSKIDNFAFDTEAVLIAGNGDFNVKYYKGKFDAYQRTYVLSGFKDTTGSFVYQKAKQALNEMIKNNQGSSVKFIKMGDLTDYPLLLPPLPEQQKIAEILGAVDEDIAKTQEVIEATEKLKRGLMQQLFTRGIGHTKFKETKIGQIPVEWSLVQIKDSPIKIADGNYSAKYPRQDEFLEDGIPFVRVNNLQDQTLIKQDLKYISPEKHADLKKGHLKTDDVLITTRGKLGVIALVPSEFDDANINAQIVLLRADNKELQPKFLMYFLLSPEFQSQVFSGGSGSALQQLPVRVLENTYIPIPTPREQKQIAEILSAVDDKISINKKLKAKLTLLKKGLMQDLLSGRVRVNHLLK